MSHQIVQSKLDLLSLGDADQRPMLGGERFNIDRSAASRALCRRMGSPMISRFDLSGAVLIRSRSFGSVLLTEPLDPGDSSTLTLVRGCPATYARGKVAQAISLSVTTRS